MMIKKMMLVLVMMGFVAGCVGGDDEEELAVGETATATATPAATPKNTEAPIPTDPFFDNDQFDMANQIPTPAPTITPTPAATPSYFVRDGTPVAGSVEAINRDNISELAELAILGYGSIEQVEFANESRFMIVQTPIAIYAYLTGTLDEQWNIQVPTGVSAMSIPGNQE